MSSLAPLVSQQDGHLQDQQDAETNELKSQARADQKAHKERFPMPKFSYDLFLWVLSLIMDLFFREVHPRGSWKIPRRGPVIFVAAPHANQFVDPLLLMRTIRLEARRRVAILVAAKSMKRKFIGWGARQCGAVPVGRALDLVKPAQGLIYMPDPINDPCLIHGKGVDFEKDAESGGLVVLPHAQGSAANTEILEVINKQELRLKKPFKGPAPYKQLTGRSDVDEDGNFSDKEMLGVAPGFEGIKFKTAPKVDQSVVFESVFDRLKSGGAIGIFPEGGSHDRTEFLPLKAGVAIMALGALAETPNSGLTIVPCGMNYFHAHKFRSRAVIEFGNPLEVPPELVEMYKKGDRREAIAQLLDTIYNALVAVTVTSPDFDTLQLIQAVRRLYNPTGKKLPLPMVVELNRRLVKGYTHYKDDQRIISLKKNVIAYNKQLKYLNLRDHQVEYASFSIPLVVLTLFYRIGKIATLSIGVIPGLVLFAPVFIVSKVISIRKSREALAASTVKLAGRDVMATWKILVSMALAPTLYTFYSVLLVYWTYRNRVQGYVPTWVPLWSIIVLGYIVFPAITFAALRFGEVGMDIVKSLRPLFLCLDPSSTNVVGKLRERRNLLSTEVTELINKLGPELFPDFNAGRIVSDPFSKDEGKSNKHPSSDHKQTGLQRQDSLHRANLPRNESFGNLGAMGLFTTRPPSRNASRPDSPVLMRSRSSSRGGGGGVGFGSGGSGFGGGFKLNPMSTLEGTNSFEAVSERIRGAMRERGSEREGKRRVREREGEGEGWSSDEEEEGRKDV